MPVNIFDIYILKFSNASWKKKYMRGLRNAFLPTTIFSQLSRTRRNIAISQQKINYAELNIIAIWKIKVFILI